MTYVRRFCRFWVDFVAGDDWAVALGVVVTLAATWFATHHGRNWYWVLPVAVIALIAVSLRRASRGR